MENARFSTHYSLTPLFHSLTFHRRYSPVRSSVRRFYLLPPSFSGFGSPAAAAGTKSLAHPPVCVRPLPSALSLLTQFPPAMLHQRFLLLPSEGTFLYTWGFVPSTKQICSSKSAAFPFLVVLDNPDNPNNLANNFLSRDNNSDRETVPTF